MLFKWFRFKSALSQRYLRFERGDDWKLCQFWAGARENCNFRAIRCRFYACSIDDPPYSAWTVCSKFVGVMTSWWFTRRNSLFVNQINKNMMSATRIPLIPSPLANVRHSQIIVVKHLFDTNFYKLFEHARILTGVMWKCNVIHNVWRK